MGHCCVHFAFLFTLRQRSIYAAYRPNRLRGRAALKRLRISLVGRRLHLFPTTIGPVSDRYQTVNRSERTRNLCDAGLQKQMEKLSTKLAKIEASTRSNQANWRSDTQTFNNNGRRVDTRRVDARRVETRVNRTNRPPPH